MILTLKRHVLLYRGNKCSFQCNIFSNFNFYSQLEKLYLHLKLILLLFNFLKNKLCFIIILKMEGFIRYIKCELAVLALNIVINYSLHWGNLGGNAIIGIKLLYYCVDMKFLKLLDGKYNCVENQFKNKQVYCWKY